MTQPKPTFDFVYIFVKGRFERDYMSIAEVSEQKSLKDIANIARNEQKDDDQDGVVINDKEKVSRRGSVYL